MREGAMNIATRNVIICALVAATSMSIVEDAWAQKKKHKSTTTTTTTTVTSTTFTTVTTTSTTTTTIPMGSSGGGEPTGKRDRYSIISVGTVDGQTRVVTIEGLRRLTWADYALWSDNNRAIYFKSGETFQGKVHANTELYFSGDPEFFEYVTSAASTFVGSTNNVVFHAGFETGSATGSMATVNFTNLLGEAQIVYTGKTQIAFTGTNMLVSNARNGWTNYSVATPADGLIYIQTASTGSDKDGDAFISGTVDGRVTIATDRDVNITNNLLLADSPSTNQYSTDALGLISRHNIVVTSTFPNNGQIYAHMMATGLDTTADTDGSFGVANFDSGAPRGVLTVYGGIVQDYRGAVGTFNSGSGTLVTGYDKNYIYDTRYREDPPPHYPPLSNNLNYGVWRDSY
jgi:hypothetical protein